MSKYETLHVSRMARDMLLVQRIQSGLGRRACLCLTCRTMSLSVGIRTVLETAYRLTRVWPDPESGRTPLAFVRAGEGEVEEAGAQVPGTGADPQPRPWRSAHLQRRGHPGAAKGRGSRTPCRQSIRPSKGMIVPTTYIHNILCSGLLCAPSKLLTLKLRRKCAFRQKEN